MVVRWDYKTYASLERYIRSEEGKTATNKLEKWLIETFKDKICIEPRLVLDVLDMPEYTKEMDLSFLESIALHERYMLEGLSLTPRQLIAYSVNARRLKKELIGRELDWEVTIPVTCVQEEKKEPITFVGSLEALFSPGNPLPELITPSLLPDAIRLTPLQAKKRMRFFEEDEDAYKREQKVKPRYMYPNDGNLPQSKTGIQYPGYPRSPRNHT